MNAHKRVYQSEILGKRLDILCSTTTMRMVRKYGGFDNYILLTREKHMRSIYGEYLRELMLRKVNNPDFEVRLC